MSRRVSRRRLTATVIASTLLATGTAAGAKTTDFLDLEAGVGYSSNPLLRIPSRSSVFGRVSAYGVHEVDTERGSTIFSGYVENTTYLRDYGSKQIFDLTAHTNQAVSPTVTIFGDLDFSGDVAGQLSNRLYYVPSQPPVPEPGNPLPPPTTAPSAFGLTGRQYRIDGQLGASIRSGSRGTISLSAGAQRIIFTGDNSPDDYNVYFGSGGYSQQVSERTSAGATLYLQRQDFSGGDYANIVNPVATIRTQLRENLTADASVGILALDERRGTEKDHSVTPSFSGSLCSNTTRSRLCAHVARDAQSTLSGGLANRSGGAAITTVGSIDYYRRVGANDTIQASLSADYYSTPGSFEGQKFRSTYISGVLGYDRKIGSRIYGGIQAGTRKLFQDGPDPKLDLNASVYLRYRLGDLL